jgi:hypothetical protein
MCVEIAILAEKDAILAWGPHLEWHQIGATPQVESKFGLFQEVLTYANDKNGEEKHM